MSSEQELISWKTDAWKDGNMVAGYAQRMIDPSGAIMMKNRIEIAAFARYAEGKKILDVGIGTGRASLPLARGGYAVTGIDSSVAMLQKTKELAGSTPLDLFEGDVAELRFADGTFDTVMGLNTIAHFPHWQPILKEWQRVLKPGGRMVFDMFSLDHDIAYGRATGQTDQFGIDHFAPKDAAGFYLRLKVEDVVQFAGDLGMHVVKIQPYSVLIGSSGFNRFLVGTPLAGKAWDRLLTWIGADQKLFDFLTFVEEELFGNLTSKVACRYVVVLDNVPNAAGNADWLQRDALLNSALTSGLNRATMAVAGIDAAAFRSSFNAQLAHLPNRYAFFRMLMANTRWSWPIALQELLEEPYLRECYAVTGRANADAAITSLLEAFHEAPQLKAGFMYRGVPVANALEYDLMIALLDGPLGAFAGSLSESLGARGR